jgi:hypothetical protein
MRLRQAHQILIGSAIGLAVVFGVRSAVLYTRGHARQDLMLTFASLVVAVALLGYLRHVRAKWAGADRP